MITQTQLKEIIHYNPDTGDFNWAITRSSKCIAGRPAGNTSKNGKNASLSYRRIYILGKFYKAHRLAFLYMTGSFPVGEVDHINGDGTDNRWCNLRDVDRLTNGKNISLKVNNDSGLHGVSWNESRGKWRVRIMVDHKEQFLGRFSDFFEAACARKSAEVKSGFHENHGRLKNV